NYILRKFQEFETQSSGGIEPSFFVFSGNACGIPNNAHNNVLATVNGTFSPERFFIAIGHMDTRTIDNCDNTATANCANDDGSGTVTSMEMARVLSNYSQFIESSMIFMAVTGEEQSLMGSTVYANWALQNNMRIDGMITNDIVGGIEGCVDPSCPTGKFIVDSSSVRHFSGGTPLSTSRQLSRYMKLKAEQYVTDVDWKVNLIPFIDRPGRGGDHIPFFNNGYAAVRFTEAHEFGDGSGGNGHQHNGTDSIQYVNFNYITRIVKTNLAGLAILAMAPETPQSPLHANNVGNGTDLVLDWEKTNSEPDFGGYRIAVRYADSLFYDQIINVGNVNEFTITGLVPEAPIYISHSAIDTSGNESIFSSEILVLPSTIPGQPHGFNSTSTQTGIQLTWVANTELDLGGYKITRENPSVPTVQFDLDSTAVSFFDNTADPHILYNYSIQAVDIENNLSTPSGFVPGQLATHDSGILVLDVSKDGPGISPLLPSDLQVDSYYHELLDNFNVALEWDVADSLEIDLRINDAVMAPFSTVIVHSDVRLPTNKISGDTTSLKEYIVNGGNILFSGWQLLESITDLPGSVNVFSPGDFVHDNLKIDTVRVADTDDFNGADPQVSGYVSVTVDSVKLPNFGGDLISMEVFGFLESDPNTDLLYTYRSSDQPPSQFDGKPVGIFYNSTNNKIILIDFPLYYMIQSEAEQLITKALTDFGEVMGIEDDGNENEIVPNDFKLHQNYPNPFNPVTTIKFDLPKAVNVSLKIYNTIGEQLAVLIDNELEAGSHQVEFDASHLSSGIYFYEFRADEFIQTKKMILMK
ncbi:MAG: M28 family peptidase, partial [Ignavibacteriales bacterium]